MDYKFAFKNDIDLKSLFEAVKKCEHEVWFESDEGDRLSLGSALSQLILYSVISRSAVTDGCVLHCFSTHDMELLRQCLEQ